ncbi:unnamed protein product [Didymodactylos carnosus]|uniref:RING-type domain-containing protein n=1 Tax=Didymodactylos carnosus TaxID=1234261 RepID=A0A813SH37_9BILA|nr:unnamed protein product [Didymodactylos carnosus]CAF0794500.1 unnamed protein product [Didymodactylos carnosus]CAF3532732.1 unnamed protein product [Didymodactylos carnosus]CAF3579167.1 unnamed protein product [Didymodactylos carnosus]
MSVFDVDPTALSFIDNSPDLIPLDDIQPSSTVTSSNNSFDPYKFLNTNPSPISTTTTTIVSSSTSNQQHHKEGDINVDVSDWRNIQVDPLWTSSTNIDALTNNRYFNTNILPFQSHITSSTSTAHNSNNHLTTPQISNYPWTQPLSFPFQPYYPNTNTIIQPTNSNNSSWLPSQDTINSFITPPTLPLQPQQSTFNRMPIIKAQPPPQQQQQQPFFHPIQPPLPRFNTDNNNVIDLTMYNNTVNANYATNSIRSQQLFTQQPLPKLITPVLTKSTQAPRLPSTTITTPWPHPPTDVDLLRVPDIDIESIIVQVEMIIPDIDVDNARRQITAMNPIPSLDDIITYFFDNGYIKKKNRKEQDKHTQIKRSWSDTIDDIPKFLLKYADPISFFFDIKRKVSDSYINHAKPYLIRAFPSFDKTILEQALKEENNHFLPTLRKLETRSGIRTNAFVTRRSIKRALDQLDVHVDGISRSTVGWAGTGKNKYAFSDIPMIPCEEFYDELRFAKNEKKIRSYIQKQIKEHEKKVKKAKRGHQTIECEVCMGEDLLVDDMVECSAASGHLACRVCVRTYVETGFKEGKCRFPCVRDGCHGEYSMRLLTELLPPKDIERLSKRSQEENIRQASIDGLETCPYCPYAVIVDNQDDKVFRCLNPDCMRETCRLCKELNHIPLRCDEVEKGIELEMRKFIEEHVTEAMIRKCPRCTTKFYKTDGCNKITCSSCGLYICYMCRQQINGYDHFTNNDRCTLSNTSEKIHYDEMVGAYSNAKAEYLRLHPDAREMVLRYDPIAHLKHPATTTTTTLVAGH